MANILGIKLQEMNDYYKDNRFKEEKIEDFFIRYCENKIDLDKTNLDFIIKYIADNIISTKQNYSLEVILKEIAKDKNIDFKEVLNLSFYELKEDLEKKHIELQNRDIKRITDKLLYIINSTDVILDKNKFNIYDFIALLLLVSLKDN